MNRRVSRSANEGEACYAAALRLVQGIDRHLQAGTRHYYDTQGRLLTTLDQVVNAILSNTLQPTQKGEKNQ
jgi:hypothetical protein